MKFSKSFIVLLMGLALSACAEVKFDKRPDRNALEGSFSGGNGTGAGGGGNTSGPVDLSNFPGGVIGGEPRPVSSYPSEITEPGRCTETFRNSTKKVKLLFVVDMSGSNADSYETQAPGDGTDPQKLFRAGSIRGFVEKFGRKPNLGWSAITFQDLFDATQPKALALINQGRADLPRFGAADAMESAIGAIEQLPDSGRTPYKAAIHMAQKVLKSDPDLGKPDQHYAVVFITDGMPTDYIKCVSSDAGQTILLGDKSCPGQLVAVDDAALIRDVEATAGIAAGRVTFNTVYYGETSTNKENSVWRLGRLAAAGGGNFYDASSLSTFKIEDAIRVPGVVCP